MNVSLSILTIDYGKVAEELAILEKELEYLHLDVMDGNFVPNISFGPAFIQSLRNYSKLIFDTHLMIENPLQYIEKFSKAGSDYITIHIESQGDIMCCLEKIKSYGIKAGLSIKPNTKVEEIKPYLPLLDMVLVMSVEPGFGGQVFMESSIEKVKELKSLREQNNYHYLINIDGGINDKTAPKIAPYVDLAVSGSYVLNAENPIQNLNILKNI